MQSERKRASYPRSAYPRYPMYRSPYPRYYAPSAYPRSAAAAITRKISKKIDAKEETKYTQNSGNGTVLTGTPVMGAVGLMAQGLTVSTRIGNQTPLVGLELKVACDCAAAATSRLRCLLIRDRNTNGALPATAVDFFMDKTAASSWFSAYDPSTVGVGKRYEILFDKTVCLNLAGGATNIPLKELIQFKTKRSRKVIYNSTKSGTIADVNVGSILFCLYTDVAANGPAYAYEYSQWFKDA